MIRVLAPSSCLFALIMAPALSAQDREAFAMGTRLLLHLEAPARVEASEAILVEVDRIEAACSTWRPDSVWSRINAAAGGPVRVDPEWIHLLAQASDWSQRTQGAFDPVLMALLRAWGTRDGGRIPSTEERLEAQRASGVALLELDSTAATVRLLSSRAGLEEGAFLKGYALDAVRRKALALGVRQGWADFGGQILSWGTGKKVDIAGPKQRLAAKASVLLSDGSLSTSGCSERGRHILDPRTGLPCEAWGSVSVAAASALDADILSTALYVLGPEVGPAWAEANHVSALFLLNDGGVRMTPGFKALRPTFFNGVQQ